MSAKQISNLLIVVLCFAIEQRCAYYLSPNLLSFEQADKFCQQRCNSELASIHNNEQHNDAILSMQVQPAMVWGAVEGAWIGLKRDLSLSVPVTYNWTDGTPLDYGADVTSSGVFPWGINQPSGYQCVQVDLQTQRWSDVDCTSGYTHALCNHCDGVINHFALVATSAVTRSEAQQMCSQRYNTTLASIHNAGQWQEIRTLWNLTDGKAWIGLQSDNDSQLVWDDERVFDFGTEVDAVCQPWNGASQSDNLGGNGNCGVWVNSEGCWDYDTANCTTSTAYAICGLQSELSAAVNNWEDPDWYYWGTWNVEKEYLISNPAISQEAETILMDKWFHNGDEMLNIEWTFFPVFDTSDEAWVGLSVFNDPSASYCHWYWFGLYISGGDLYLEVGREDPENGEVYPIDFVIDHTLSTDRDTTMLIQIAMTDSHPVFSVFLDGVEHLSSFLDSTGFQVIQSGHSGHIGLWHGSGAMVVNKYLYVSGTPQLTTLFDLDWCNSMNRFPTEDPTAPPSSEHGPTSDPTESIGEDNQGDEDKQGEDDGAEVSNPSVFTGYLLYVSLGGGIVLVSGLLLGCVAYCKRKKTGELDQDGGEIVDDVDQAIVRDNSEMVADGIQPHSVPPSGMLQMTENVNMFGVHGSMAPTHSAYPSYSNHYGVHAYQGQLPPQQQQQQQQQAYQAQQHAYQQQMMQQQQQMQMQQQPQYPYQNNGYWMPPQQEPPPQQQQPRRQIDADHVNEGNETVQNHYAIAQQAVAGIGGNQSVETDQMFHVYADDQAPGAMNVVNIGGHPGGQAGIPGPRPAPAQRPLPPQRPIPPQPYGQVQVQQMRPQQPK